MSTLVLVLVVCSVGFAQPLHWQRAGTPAFAITVLLGRDSTIFAGSFALDSGGLYRSTDRGATWTLLENALGRRDIYSLAQSDSNLFVTADYAIYRLDRDGTGIASVLVPIADGITQSYLVEYAVATTNSMLIVGTDHGVYRSALLSDTIHRITAPPDLDSVYSLIVIDSTVHATTHGHGAYRSTDDGATWVPDSGLPKIVYRIIGERSRLLAGTERGMFISLDGGVHWQHDQSTITNVPFWCLASRGDTIVAGTGGLGMMITTNGGATWNQANDGMTGDYIQTVCSLEDQVFAGNESGLWRALLKPSTAVRDRAESSSLQTTLTFFPNPVHDELYVRTTSAPGAELIVYNVVGERVASAHVGSSGIQLLHVRSLPTGMYTVVAQQGTEQRRSIVTIVR